MPRCRLTRHRAVRHPRACRYFRTRHALDKPQDQCLPIGVGETPDRIEDGGGLAFAISFGDSALGFVVGRVIGQLVLWHANAGSSHSPDCERSPPASLQSFRFHAVLTAGGAPS